ncbi:MAG: translation elongation factor Ts [Phycisphaerae bacterium]|nr:translation elongation factor Ts [Phycisphaerae bacterium]MBM92073.1 translation elongation factor Ts [Phycisphaerae bacterium]HCT46339.1 translation elongation factor Ts [Phycisphaerales bacterium]
MSSTSISAKDVMNLRNKTGLAMMECKKALQEANGNVDEAETLLRKKLKGKMETKSDRVAGEGRVEVAVSDDGAQAALVKVKAETDFTAKNEKFVDAVKKIAQLALNADAGDVSPTDEMKEIIDELRISTGENISIDAIEKLVGEPGKTQYGFYVHHDGKTGSLIEAQGDVDGEVLRQLAMHVTAAVPRPLGLTSDDIPSDLVEKERKFRIDQAVESGKPQQIAEKMVEGGMKKFFSEVALLEQPFVMDPSKAIRDLIGDAELSNFRRWQVGESEG